jgi:RimJ/RimL family protein N-acetyltransferase
MSGKKYVFTSQRLGFRNWLESDLDAMSAINLDARVMEFFPATQSREHTKGFIERMQKQFSERRYCYFAACKLDNDELIGFIGINFQTFESDFTPCVDIGWRIKFDEWGKGYASEGAQKCLEYAFQELGIEQIFSIATKINLRSIHIMKKIGMKEDRHFIFPALKGDERLQECVLFKICR